MRSRKLMTMETDDRERLAKTQAGVEATCAKALAALGPRRWVTIDPPPPQQLDLDRAALWWSHGAAVRVPRRRVELPIAARPSPPIVRLVLALSAAFALVLRLFA